MAASVLPPPRSRLTLERVLGLTALSNTQVAVNPVSGELAYAAGCIVVIYNLRRNKQVRYYRVDKSVACLCFSPNGQFLAIGEKGYLPAITIWDGTDGTLCAELQRHQYGVACMAFSQDGRFLLSAGLVHDQHLYAWELKLKGKDAGRRLEVTAAGCAFIEDKILDADYCQAGNFFVTVGEKHFKYWFLDDNGSFLVTGLSVNELPELQHRDAVVNAKTSATFTGVGCGYGSCELKTFAVTSDGTLCCLGASGIMERLVSLEANVGNAISVTESYIAVGGSSGVVRMFDPSTLEYRATLPFPPAFGAANEPSKVISTSPSVLYPADSFRYPTVIASRITGAHVIVFYSDRSIFIYNTANLDAVTVERSFLYHSGGIRDLQVAGLVRGINSRGKLIYTDGGSAGGVSADTIPTGTFVTCSDDNTVRLWNLELHRRPAKPSRFESCDSTSRTEHEYWKNPYSQEMLRVIYNDHEHDFEDEHCVVLGGTCSHDSSTSVHSPPKGNGRNKGLNAVSVRPDQKEIAAGDQEGNVAVIPVPLEKPVIRIGAHSSKVNCLAYSSVNDDGTMYMASGGKDRLIQLYDCQSGYVVLSTLESHSGAVTTVSLSRDGKTLLSCGADSAVLVSGIDEKGGLIESKALPFPAGKIFDAVLLPDGDTVVACCNNNLEVLSASTGKQKQTHVVGEQLHAAVCPANYCVAISGSLAERTIHIIDMKTGDTLAMGTGHGEAITALKFTPDCRRLLSASSDGCIFVWRLAEEIQAEIKARLPRVMDGQRLIPAPLRATNAEQQTSALPPPAPPISGPATKKIVTLSGPTSSLDEHAAAVDIQNSAPSDLAEVDKATPKRIPKRSPPKWKGNGVAVPGPMACIPMEDWMRTRTTANPTIHMLNGNEKVAEMKTGLKIPSNNGTLLIDRLQTPDWALTTPSGTDPGQSFSSSPPREEAVGRHALVHGKWGMQIAALLPSDDGVFSTNDLELSGLKIQQDNSQEERSVAIPTPNHGKDDLTKLSVEVLDTNPKMLSSLALEREDLEKRRKQVDTANAVAAMNTRLSQLGLLKPPQNPPTPQLREMNNTTQSPPMRLKASPMSNSSTATMLPSPKLVTSVGQSPPRTSIPIPKKVIKETSASVIDQRTDIRGNSPDEPLGESFEMVPSPVKNEGVSKFHMEKRPVRTVNEKDKSAPPNPFAVEAVNSAEILDDINHSDEDTDKFTEDLVSQALCKLNSEEPLRPPPMDEQVVASLSLHSSGYGPQEKQFVSAEKHSRSSLEVKVSLSSFTSGFTAPSRLSQAKDEIVRHSVETLASSLSAFTKGYAGQDCDPNVDESLDAGTAGNAMNASMSTFTCGYSTQDSKDPADIIRKIPVDVSLSNFTSGYEANKLQVDVHPGSNDLSTEPLSGVMKASLSAFTSGYGAEVSPLSNVETTASKCVNTQAPSRLDDDDNNPESSQLKLETSEAAALKVMSGLCLPLEDAATVLSDILSNLAPDADPKLREIEELVGALRSAITAKLKS